MLLLLSTIMWQPPRSIFRHRWIPQLRIIPVVQHERFGMQHVVADMGLRRERLRHDLPYCLEKASRRNLANGASAAKAMVYAAETSIVC
jgi:hypothetical protein